MLEFTQCGQANYQEGEVCLSGIRRIVTVVLSVIDSIVGSSISLRTYNKKGPRTEALVYLKRVNGSRKACLGVSHSIKHATK